MGDTQRSRTISTKLQQIAEKARRNPDMVFTALTHHIDVDFLREAYKRIRKDASPGLDGVTAEEYAEHLEENLQSLYDRMRSGQYKAPLVKRVWLNNEGKNRPIGISEFEDKIVQRAVTMLLGAVYEQDFYDFSHAFREGHSQHKALRELREQCMTMNIGWIVEVDVTGFFDNMDHSWIRKMIQQRVNDGGLMRYIGKWLKAGVVDGETLSYPEKGTPQGGVVSPMLSNIFLHHVLDEWFEKDVKPRMKGRCFLIRFADDFIIGCEQEEDARRIMAVLPKRFNRFGLTIHPEKTKLFRFRKPISNSKNDRGNETFDFLGFTHCWARSRRGYWVIKRETARKRMHRTKKSLWEWCKENRHKILKEQWQTLCLKLRGYFQYYGIRSNYRKIESIFEYAKRAWRYWLSRRSHKGFISSERFEKLLTKFSLPKPRIVHNI